MKTVYNTTYHKIPNLWDFDTTTKIFKYGVYATPEIESLKHNVWVFTEKVDGTNLRLIWDGYTLTYKGRTETSEFIPRHNEFIQTNLVNEDMEQGIEQLFKDKEVIIFGEMYGFDIQRVKAGELYNPNTYEFRVFDISINGIFLERHNVEDIATKLGFGVVPILLQGTIEDALNFLSVEDNKLSSFSKAPLEGLVGVPKANLYDRLGNRIIVKVLPKHLLHDIELKQIDYEKRHTCKQKDKLNEMHQTMMSK